ncbi:MAG: exodeoxyribonuclease VII small subunit [Planctomycetota bacterium]|nr:MAG: exodeoxyribonuclease VII small subunit [Planctomycetota bacterium]
MAKTSSDKISDAANVDQSISNLGYEDAMQQLESIVDQLESGAISLEESLKAFERGRALSNHCRAILDNATKRIQTLTADALSKQEPE